MSHDRDLNETNVKDYNFRRVESYSKFLICNCEIFSDIFNFVRNNVNNRIYFNIYFR